MKKLFVAVVFVFGSLSLNAETPAVPNHGDKSVTQSPSTSVPVPPVEKSSKLFEYVSACLAERPQGSNLQDLLSRFK